ncbi:glycoside hydrolase family 88 protein [Paraflavitalea pollutisoli]|uniref:glycoside hydrolase family 88 protein n=1 Tax=Paraflavitalea pollutisoli TaxID=3034143 RepID=UPI0023EB000C|nr:glycoside hydrolase family 88 protein [Paraflavitalea sp. H1-2-19X]
MKKFLFAGLLCVGGALAAFAPSDEGQFISRNLDLAKAQVKLMVQAMERKEGFPRTINPQGEMVSTNMYDWTPGFFPGSLWYAYEFSNDTAIRSGAIRWTERLEPLKFFTEHHDLGFMMYCSYGNAYRLTGNPKYKDDLVQAARSLSTRFDPKVGCIKSWNNFRSWHGNKVYQYPVIIDNLMNLELLFFATKMTGDSSFYQTAITHADNTLKHQFRKDYSSYHVVCYNKETGAVEGRETAQGLSDNSTWARGQAWAIYGYTMIYRETGDVRYLKAARGMADFYLQHKNLPADKVPYWDFNIGQTGYQPGVNSYALKDTRHYRDASAAAITAAALIELSTYVGKAEKRYREPAITMLKSLASPAYRSEPGTNGDFLIKHCVGSIPHQTEIDVPLVYADYYFIEALQRYKTLLKGEKLFPAETKGGVAHVR